MAFRSFRLGISLFIAAVVLGGLARVAEAQTVVRYYFVPKVVSNFGGLTFVSAKYILPGQDATVIASVGFNGVAGHVSLMDYGAENLMLARAEVTAAENTALAAQIDVLGFPANLDNTVAGALSIVRTRLESMNLPGNFVQSGWTWRQVLGLCARAAQFMQRYQAVTLSKLFELGITLDTQYNEFTQAQKSRLQQVAADMKLDVSGVTSTTTVRQALKAISDQMFPNGLNFSGDVLAP